MPATPPPVAATGLVTGTAPLSTTPPSGLLQRKKLSDGPLLGIGKKKISSSTNETTGSPAPVTKKSFGDGESTPTSTPKKSNVKGLFAAWRRKSSKTPMADDEKRRVRELLLGSALRRFSLSHPALMPKPGTLRINVQSCSIAGMRASGWLGAKAPKRLFFVEGELGAAKGRTEPTGLAKSGREATWKEGSDRVLRLYYPGDATQDPLLAAMSNNVSGQSRKRIIVHLRVMEKLVGADPVVLSETAVEMERLLQIAEDKREWALPLVVTSDLEDAGVLCFDASFNRVRSHKNHDHFAEAAENLAAEAASLLMAPHAGDDAAAAHEGFHAGDASVLAPVFLLPSAAAAIASVAASLSTKPLETVEESGSRYSWPERAQPLEKRRLGRAASMPELNGNVDVHVANPEQLASLREGYRMWRVAHRSQLQPSHRTDIVQAIGERFVNNNSDVSPSFLLSPLVESDRSLSIMAIGDSIKLDSSQRSLVSHITARLSAMSNIEQKSVRVTTTTTMRPGYAKNKTCVLTGGTRGVGGALASSLARFGVSHLILFVHDVDEGRVVAQQLSKSKQRIEIDVVACDLCSMKSTAQACDMVRSFLDGKPLDLLVLCAAAVFRERGTTAEGLERTFACNYLSNFLIVHSLFDLVEKSPGARIVAAGCASFSPLSLSLNLDDLQAEKGQTVGPLGLYQYSHTKLMVECFIAELARRLRDKGSSTTANVFHPGAIKSKLSDEALEAFSPFVAKLANAALSFSTGTLVRTPEQGCALGEFLVNDIDIAGVSGKLFDSGFTGKVVDFSPKAFAGVVRDDDVKKRLWALSGKTLNTALGDGRVAEWWAHFAPTRGHKAP